MNCISALSGMKSIGERHPDAGSELRVQIQVRGRVVEAEPDVLELIRVDAVDDVRRGGVAVRQVLHLRGERGAEIELEARVLDTRRLRRLEDVQPAPIERAHVLNLDGATLLPGLEDRFGVGLRRLVRPSGLRGVRGGGLHSGWRRSRIVRGALRGGGRGERQQHAESGRSGKQRFHDVPHWRKMAVDENDMGRRAT
jgi:hypothetical protein